MDDKILKKNIKFLMSMRGMTQKEMAEILHYEGAHSISQWLNERTIPDEVVEKIANYFEFSTLMLKYVDLEENIHFNNDSYYEEYFKILFPYEENEKALKNENFKKAFYIHMNYFDYNFPDTKEKAYEKALECYKLYKASYDDGIVEGLINMLSISSLYKMILKSFNFEVEIDKVNLDEDLDEMNENDKRKLFKQLSPYNNQDRRQEIKKFLITSSTEIYNILYKLKEKEKRVDIADFYIAVLHLNNLLFSGFEESENMQFGLMYFNILDKMKNKYFIKLQDFNKKHQQDIMS